MKEKGREAFNSSMPSSFSSLPVAPSSQSSATPTANQRFRTAPPGYRKFNLSNVGVTDSHDAVDLHRVPLAAGSGVSTASTAARIEAPAKKAGLHVARGEYWKQLIGTEHCYFSRFSSKLSLCKAAGARR